MDISDTRRDGFDILDQFYATKHLKMIALKVNTFKGNFCFKSTLFGSLVLYFFLNLQ